MVWQILMNFIPGLFLFIYGIMSLSNEMQKFLGGRFRKYLAKITKRPLYGATVGALMTTVIQSSSATTVIAISLVNAGLLNLYQSLGIIFGANIGTTITAQFVAFKVTELAPVLIAIGFLLFFFTSGKKQVVGKALFYLGILFFGIILMGNALGPLKQSQGFVSFLSSLENPLLAMLVAAAFTGIVQSSSVTTGIVVLMAQQGLISLAVGIPLILGANIGTTVTALIASTGTTRNAKRCAVSHMFFNIFGVLMFLPFIYVFAGALQSIGGSVANQVANAHTIFNVVTTLILLALVGPFYKFVMFLMPKKKKERVLVPIYIKDKLSTNPIVAIDLAKKELAHQAEIAINMVEKSVEFILKKSRKVVKDIGTLENAVNSLQREITMFLVRTSERELSRHDAKQVAAYSRIVNEIERIADHAVNLVELGNYKMDEKAEFSKYAKKEIEDINLVVLRNVKQSVSLVRKYKAKTIEQVYEDEERVDELVERAHSRHIKRLHKGTCTPVAGTVFVDVINNLEKMSDHALNIAQQIERMKGNARKV